MIPFVFDLGATSTYARRGGVYVECVDGFIFMPGGEVVPALGKLTLRVQFAERAWGRKPVSCEIDTYGVELGEPKDVGTVTFVLTNLTDPDAEEPYEVTVGGRVWCRCMAGRCKVPTGCKHVHAVQLLVKEGYLPARHPAAPTRKEIARV